jgi:predicted ATPase
MLTRLRLENFKSFKEAELTLGPLTLLVSTNASGKSNIRDAFRFLHGIARGYALADIFGGKWGEGGERVWSGIRGGPREAAFREAEGFGIEVDASLPLEKEGRKANYRCGVAVPRGSTAARVVDEVLRVEGGWVFGMRPDDSPSSSDDTGAYILEIAGDGMDNITERASTESFRLSHPFWDPYTTQVDYVAGFMYQELSSMRFLDLDPDAMRIPSLPGQNVLGDRGENLSSVLQAICEKPDLKRALVHWIQALTPMDAKDLEFPADFSGKVLVHLIEENGQKTSAYSASDGTLRFLALAVALLGPEPPRFLFVEELENGIHPTRLHLLLQLIEQQVKQGRSQVIATTHSPLLLHNLSPEMREFAHLTYRLEGHPDTRIKRILDIPDARRVIEGHGLLRLHESGWLENAVEFTEGEEDAA